MLQDMDLNEQSKRILTRIVVLHEHIDELRERFPEPMPPRMQKIIEMFEQKIMHEVKKLKELNDL